MDVSKYDFLLASVPGLPRYAFTLRFNFAGEVEIGEGLGANVT